MELLKTSIRASLDVDLTLYDSTNYIYSINMWYKNSPKTWNSLPTKIL